MLKQYHLTLAKSRSLAVHCQTPPLCLCALHQRHAIAFKSGLSAPTIPSRMSKRSSSRLHARLESAELPLGTPAPEFQLLDTRTGDAYSSSELQDAKAVLLIFMCNHCPFVKLLKGSLVELANQYQPEGVKVVAISSNSVETHPQDGPQKMSEDAQAQGYPFPYLYDESQDVAKAYQAVCTPEFFVFDSQLKLQYHGQYDNARPSNDVSPTGEDVRNALDAILQGKEPATKAKPSIGCSIKWHPGSK